LQVIKRVIIFVFGKRKGKILFNRVPNNLIPYKMAKKVVINKKKAIRKMRTTARKNSDGTVSSHKMGWVGDPSKKRGDFGVFPTITPKEGKESSTKASDWKSQTPKEAAKKGEMIKVKSKRKAEKLAAGSWKKGPDKKEAMKAYRSGKKK